jgi:cold-shock-like DNA binding protein
MGRAAVSRAGLQWDEKASKLDADPAATVSLDRSAWERVGAVFHDRDDREGEMPGLATATVQLAGRAVRIGVVDYGENSTYLLVPGVEPKRLATTTAVLEALEAEGVLHIQTDLLDLANVAPPPSLEDRVAELERQLFETQSKPVRRARTRTKIDQPDAQAEPSVIRDIVPGTVVVTRVFFYDLGQLGAGVTGTVKWFNRDKGYGLIEPNDSEQDAFVGYLKAGNVYTPLPAGALAAIETADLRSVEVLDEGKAKPTAGATRSRAGAARRRAAKKQQ